MSISNPLEGVILPSNRCRPINNPYELAPFLAKLNNSYIADLVKNCNSDIQRMMIQPIKLCCTSNSLCPVFADTTSVIVQDRRRLTDLARRAALQMVSQSFALHCIGKTASAKTPVISRMRFCPPVGVLTSSYPCNSFLCAGCRLRCANRTRNELMKRVPQNDHSTVKSIILHCDVAFDSKCFGFETPKDYDKLVERIARRMRGVPYLACKTVGVLIDQSAPYLSSRVALMVKDEEYSNTKKMLNKMRKKVLSKVSNMSTSVQEHIGLDAMCVDLYDPAPICLAGLYKDGFSSPLLQHTVEDLRTEMEHKKKVIFFGTGVQ